MIPPALTVNAAGAGASVGVAAWSAPPGLSVTLARQCHRHTVTSVAAPHQPENWQVDLSVTSPIPQQRPLPGLAEMTHILA